MACAWRVHGVSMGACFTSQEIYEWLRKKYTMRAKRRKELRARKRGEAVEEEEEVVEEEEAETESAEARQLREALEKIHEHMEKQALTLTLT